MTTNINFYGKPFGAPLLPNKMTSDGWSIADARHIGGHRVVDTVDDLYELYDWQLINPSALLNNDTDSAVGQKWYVKGDGTYMLKSYDNRTSSDGWVKVEDKNGNALYTTDGRTFITLIDDHYRLIQQNKTKLETNANKPNGAIVLDADGRIPSTAKTAFRKINGKSILKTNEDTSDITIDFSLFIIPANNTLPPVGELNKIYLLRNGSPSGPNKYTEYMYVNGAWETLGEYRAEIPISDYLKKTDAESTYVKRSSNSPATYVLSSSASLTASDATSIDKAASVALLYHVKQALQNSIDGCSKTDHKHKVTINKIEYTITGGTAIDLGSYVTPKQFNQEVSSYTYSSETIDNKIRNVTTSSLGISTLTNTEIDTMFTQIFG